MKKFFRVILWILGTVLLAGSLVYAYFYIGWRSDYKNSMALLGGEAPAISLDGHTFRRRHGG